MALTLAGLLSMSALFQTGMTSFGASTMEQKGKALYDLGLLQGYSKEKMELGLEDSLTREQAIKLTLVFLGYTDKDLDLNAKPVFTDVKKGTGWAQPWVKFATDIGITSGISSTEFGYGQPVTKRQLTTFMLRALGYESAWNQAAQIGEKLEIIQTSDLDDFNKESLRGDFAKIGYNTLTKAVRGTTYTMIEKLISKGVVDKNVASDLGLLDKNQDTRETPTLKGLEKINDRTVRLTFSKDMSQDIDAFDLTAFIVKREDGPRIDVIKAKEVSANKQQVDIVLDASLQGKGFTVEIIPLRLYR